MSNLKTMTSAFWVKWKNNHDTIPRCRSCNKPILVKDKYVSTSNNNTTNLFCQQCEKKDLLVYQPHYKNRANQHGTYITYKDYLKKYTNCKGAICETKKET